MNFEQVMMDINTLVTIDAKDRPIYAKDFETLKNYMYSEMKKVDVAFAKIASSPILGGSYADNLKVSKPDEFDLVIQLELPDQKLVDIEYEEPGYVMLNIKSLIAKIERERHNDELCRQLRDLINDDGYLVQAKFHQWMQSIVTRVITNIPDSVIHKNDMEYHIRHSIQGPAQTLHVEVEDRRFSIDFVPALRFPTSIWIAKRSCPEQGKAKHWIAVPKPRKEDNIRNDLNNLYWITSFMDQERELIKNKNFLKPSVRLIKQLRNRHDITNLKSYFIKTIFLWIVLEKDEQKENDPNFWNRGLGITFLEGYRELLKYVKDGNIPFFWDDRFNMINKLSPSQKTDIYNKLNARYNEILKCKDNNPENLYEIFLTKEQHEHLKQRNAKIINNGKLIEKEPLKPTEKRENSPNKELKPVLPEERQSTRPGVLTSSQIERNAKVSSGELSTVRFEEQQIKPGNNGESTSNKHQKAALLEDRQSARKEELTSPQIDHQLSTTAREGNSIIAKQQPDKRCCHIM